MFVAEVVDITDATPAGQAPDVSLRERAVRLTIREVLNGSGTPGEQVTVTTAADAGACGYAFEVGAAYFVQATRTATGLSVSACSRTQRSDAAAELIGLLRELKKGTPTSRLTGALALALVPVNGGYLNVQLLGAKAGTLVTARDAGGTTHDAKVDERSRFVFRGLPPGTYTLTHDLGDMFVPFPSGPIEVRLDSCFVDELVLVSIVPMRGTVKATSGALPKQLKLTIARVDEDGRPMGAQFTTPVFTEDDGSWEALALPPGRYAVGVNPFGVPTPATPYAPFWVTDANKPGTPRVFVAAETPAIVEVPLPTPLDVVTVSGRVTNADGSAARATVTLTDIAGAAPTDAGMTTTDGNGRFSLQALTGRRYRIASSAARAGGKGEVEITPDAAPPDVTIRLAPR